MVNNFCCLGSVVKDSAAKNFHGLAVDREAGRPWKRYSGIVLHTKVRIILKMYFYESESWILKKQIGRLLMLLNIDVGKDPLEYHGYPRK